MSTKPIFRVEDIPPDATTAQIRGRKINHTLNILDFRGQAGFPWVLMAANTHLSLNDLLAAMAAFGYERTRSWVSRRRWMFLDPADVRTAGAPRNADGQEARAYQIMDKHPHVSARELARILRKSGIRRGRDWVLRHRTGAASKGEEALALLKANVGLSNLKISLLVKAAGIPRSAEWVRKRKQGLARGTNNPLMPVGAA